MAFSYAPNLPPHHHHPPAAAAAGAPLHQAQDASDPPVAGHDDPADHPAASVVVGPHVGPPQWFADPLAVRVAATALGAAHALVVQQVHGAHVGVHLALQAPLLLGGGAETALSISAA